MLAALAAAACQVAPPANACSIIPPPEREANESATAYRNRLDELNRREAREWQQQSWNSATSVVLVRIVRFERYPQRYDPDAKMARVKVVRWLKGRGGGITFGFRPLSGLCSGEITLAEGELGKNYLVYFSTDRPRRKAIINAVPASYVQNRGTAGLADGE